MIPVEFDDRPMLVIAEDAFADPDSRGDGVTASEIHDIAHGSRKAWRTILDGKLNGSSFRGNEHTRRGHERESIIIDELLGLDGVVTMGGNGALFGNPDVPLHRATPDGFGIHEQLGDFGVEVKSHDEGWTRTDTTAEHFDQCQWGMHVTGMGWWLYAWEVAGVEGVKHQWIPRDDKRIAYLASQADAFIAWREAGAPEVDDIPDDVDDALADYAQALADAADAERRKKAAREVLEGFAWATQAGDEPLRKSGSRASLFFQPKPDAVTFDEDAWAAGDPFTYKAWQAQKQFVAQHEAEAVEKYPRPKPTAPVFRVTANGVA